MKKPRKILNILKRILDNFICLNIGHTPSLGRNPDQSSYVVCDRCGERWESITPTPVEVKEQPKPEIETDFKRELKELLDRYNFDMYVDFDRLGACGPIETVVMVENRGFDCEHISFDLDEFAERKLCP